MTVYIVFQSSKKVIGVFDSLKKAESFCPHKTKDYVIEKYVVNETNSKSVHLYYGVVLDIETGEQKYKDWYHNPIYRLTKGEVIIDILEGTEKLIIIESINIDEVFKIAVEKRQEYLRLQAMGAKRIEELIGVNYDTTVEY